MKESATKLPTDYMKTPTKTKAQFLLNAAKEMANSVWRKRSKKNQKK